MLVEVHAMNAASRLAVLEHALCAVAEGDDAHALAADGHTVGKCVHVGIGDALRCDGAAHPCVEYAGAVDAEEHAQTVQVGSIVHVCEGIHAALHIVVDFAEHTVDHARGACCRGNLARVEHIERECVVGLVSGTVRDGCSLAQTQFGGRLSDRQKKDMLSVINGYTKWNFIRTPESMTEGLLAPVAFRECERAADEAGALLETAERLNSELSGEALDTYHSMIYYHAAASLNLVLMYAEAGLNKELAARGLISANGYAKRVKQRIAADIRYVDAFHSTLDGKWAHCMDSAHTGFRVWDDNDWTYPVTAEVTALPCPKHAAGFRGQSEYHLGTHWGDNMVLTSEGFTRPDTEEVILDLDSRGNVSYSYEISYDCPWLICEEKCGRVETDKDGHKSVVFRADRSMINGKTSADAIVKILFDNGKEDVSRLRFIADTAPAADGENVFIEREGYCCILAEHFSEKKDTAEGGFTAIDYLGREYAAVKAFPAMTAYKDTENAPYVRYSFIAENTGTYCVRLYLMSRNPVIKGGEMCFGISANGGTPERINAVSDSFYTEHFCPEWANGVLDKVRPVTVKLALNAGRNDVYIYAGDPGIILEKLVFFPEEKGLAESYLGPCESCRAAQ